MHHLDDSKKENGTAGTASLAVKMRTTHQCNDQRASARDAIHSGNSMSYYSCFIYHFHFHRVSGLARASFQTLSLLLAHRFVFIIGFDGTMDDFMRHNYECICHGVLINGVL